MDIGDEPVARDMLVQHPDLASVRARGASMVRLAAYAHMDGLVTDLLAAEVPLDVFDAAALGRVDELEALLDADPDDRDAVSEDGFTPLHLAAFFGHLRVTELLLNRGASCDPVSTNALAVQPINSAAANSHEVVVHLLLDHGADADATMSDGYRPLHAAAHNDRPAMVRLLLERGADPNARNELGETPADVAVGDEVRAIFASL
jgi:ankyrin repeat protein